MGKFRVVEECTVERHAVGFTRSAYLTLSGITALLGGVTLQGCGEDGTVVLDNAPRVASVVVSPDTLAVFSVGETVQFSAVALTSAGSEIAGVAFDWSSSDRNIATVNHDGEVTGHASGAVAITATAKDVVGTATLLVDPDLVLQNYCSQCHRGFHVLTFETLSCPACHSVTVDPRQDENHHLVLNGHQSASAGFDLMGAHVQLGCELCHDPETAEPAFDAASQTDCFVCHASDYEAQHGGSGFPTACLGCHSMDEWTGATFDHKQASGGFELLGVHTQLACTSCHDLVSGDPLFDPASDRDCYACHSDDYQNQHGGSGYPTICLTCHTTTSWDGADFEHGSASGGFDLIGAHTQLSCTSCHDAGSFDPLYDPSSESDCIACHADDYQNQHGGSGYPTTCSNCHSVNSWEGASFDHGTASGGFDLIGAHTQLACTSCHDANGDPIYAPADEEDCIACHSDDYDREHAGSGYPTTCLTCHTVSSFEGAIFNHDSQYFPIYSGTHRNKWNGCDTCHANTNDYSVFTCFNCHKHDQAQTDKDHEGVSGYVYESSRCLECHPDGDE